MTFWAILALLVAMTALSAAAVWRGWRGPANWKIDSVRGQIAFNHWKELALGALVLLACGSMAVFWVFT